MLLLAMQKYMRKITKPITIKIILKIIVQSIRKIGSRLIRLRIPRYGLRDMKKITPVRLIQHGLRYGLRIM